MNPKLSSSVSVVRLDDTHVEFFKTNTRHSIVIKCPNERIYSVLDCFNGHSSLEDISNRFNISLDSLTSFVEFLRCRGVLENIAERTAFDGYGRFRRVIHFLNDYSESPAHLERMWKNIRQSRVLIVGLGAVGTWGAINLVQSGVRNFVLLDPDVVELSNLHRQFGYEEHDVGRYKVDVLDERLHSMANDINVTGYRLFLKERTLDELQLEHLDLILNCADMPNVDTTSRWIGFYALKKKIPHIIGGGYNFHISLVGQTVIPGESACVNCFAKSLAEENAIDPKLVRKLERPYRKIGSFGPMCALVASITGMEAIKILTKSIPPANINRRGEFSLENMQLDYREYQRRNDCEWCMF